MTQEQPAFKWVGTRPVRPDGVSKVTGTAKFGADYYLPGALYARVLRSPHAHARIVSIDVSRAAALPGVKAVMTGADLPAHDFAYVGPERLAVNFWHITRNIMAREKVLYEGHSVAAVAATRASIAREALKLIDVEYEVLPHVIDVDEAMADDAPLLFEDMITRGVDPVPNRPSNISKKVGVETGKVTVLRFVAAQDCGRAIHPSYVEGQMQGGVVQGIGWALNEEYIYGDDGKLQNAGFLDYRVPVASDVPMIEPVLVEVPNPNHPFGVKGVGEVNICAPMAAIANAIANATGRRMQDLPISPPRLKAAIDDRAEQEL